MKIVNYPHPTLRHKSKPLRRVDAELRALVDQMFTLMYDARGVGLDDLSPVVAPLDLTGFSFASIERDDAVSEAQKDVIEEAVRTALATLRERLAEGGARPALEARA